MAKQKPARHVITELRLDELSLVDKGAQEPGYMLIAKRDPEAPGVLVVDAPIDAARAADAARIYKRAILTTEAMGHVHMLEAGLDSGSTAGGDMLTPDGRYSYHNHPYVVVDGVVEIGAAMGHTHAVSTPTATTEKRAPAVKADTAAPNPSTTTPSTTAQETTMDPKQLIKAFASFDADQAAHFRGLDEAGREEFLAKSAGERTAIVKAALEADPVMHTTADGLEIRKSMDPTGVMVNLAKRTEAAEAASAVAVAKAARAELEARTAKITKHLPGTLDARCALVEAVEGIKDPELRKGALAALASGDAGNAGAFRMAGVAGGDDGDGDDAVAQMEKMAEERAKTTNETIGVAKAHLLQHDNRYLALHKRAKAERTAASA